jgi:hypothetical protein
MRRPQFSLRALLVAMLVVAAFFAGKARSSPWPAASRETGRAIKI